VVHRQLGVAEQVVLVGDEFDDLDAVQRPAVRGRAGAQLRGRLAQRHVQAGLALAHALHQVLQGQRRLAGAGFAVDQIELAGDQAAVQDLVQARHTARGTGTARGHSVLQ
jgi:hypothetical protein